MTDPGAGPRVTRHVRPRNERLAQSEISARERTRDSLLAALKRASDDRAAAEEADRGRVAADRKRRTISLDVDEFVEASRKAARSDTAESLDQLAERVAIKPEDRPAVVMLLANVKWLSTKK